MNITKRSAVPRSRKALTVFLAVLVVLLAAAAVLTRMLFSDPNAGKGFDKVTPTDTLIKKILQSASTGKECSFSVEEMNGCLSYLFQQPEAQENGSKLKIYGAAVSEVSGSSADLYLPVRYRGKNFGVVLNLTPSLSSREDLLVFRVNSVRVGRLPVPLRWALSYTRNHLPRGFSVEGNEITCQNPSIKTSYLSISASVKLSEFKLENGFLKTKTKADLQVAIP
jgi:hypothetical protein